MKMFLISDNIDTCTGMRLAGVEGFVVHERDELKDALEKAIADKEIGVLLLTEKFGRERGGALFDRQAKTLDTLIENTRDKTENQRKTLAQTILPRIALYKALQEDGLSEEDVTACVRSYMLEKVAAEKHASTARMEVVPGFYALYSRIFLKIMRTTDLQESVQEHGRDHFDVTIKRCLWHTACVENGCAELCRLFCDVDDVTYGGLKKIGFTRTKTLGYGGDCCDFHFFRKTKNG